MSEIKADDWASAFSVLIGAGHTFEGILEYSYTQFSLFLKAATRQRKHRELTAFRSVALAMGGKRGDVREFLDELTEGLD